MNKMEVEEQDIYFGSKYLHTVFINHRGGKSNFIINKPGKHHLH